MRHHLKTLGILAMIGVFASCGSKNANQRQNEQDQLIPLSQVRLMQNSVESEPEEEYPSVDYGDTLCIVGDKTYMYTSSYDENEVEIISDAKITAYKDSIALDSCIVKLGTGWFTTNGKTLKVAIGIDTVRYNITKLPKTISPILDLLPKGVKNYNVKNNFSLDKSGIKSKFRFDGYLPDSIPGWLNNYIAAVLNTDVDMIFNDFEPKRTYIEEYKRVNSNPKVYKGLDISTASPKEIGRYFSRRFERLYKKEFGEEEGWGPMYEYMMEVTPEWTSEDGKLSTYRFYTYNYGGGAHGMMYEYYLTFDTESGRILGIEDIYEGSEFKKVMTRLGKKINIKYLAEDGRETNHTADLGRVGDEEASEGIWYENYNGYVYPRPALVKNGVVFSYQPYDKGSFAAGILHFVIPK